MLRFFAVPPEWRADPRGNIVGGLLAAIVSLPMAMGLGALAFSPLGPEYAARGVLAGLYAAAFLGLIAVLMGARGVAIYAPRSLVSFMIASVCSDVLLGAKWLPTNNPDAVMSAVFLLLALAGAFQLAFGLARLSRIMKFIPAPVIAGFQNAASVIIMLSQLHVLLGLPVRPALAGWPAAFGEIRPLSLVVGVATLAVVFQAHRITRRVPALILGLAAGTALYYLLAALGFGRLLGPTLGYIPFAVPDGRQVAEIIYTAALPGFGEALPALVLGAVTIAVVASLDVMISAKVVENLSHRRGNSTQELLSVGTANLITPLLGGVAGSISLAATTTAHRGGARNSLALLVHAVLFLVLVPLLAPVIGHLPRVVIAAVVFYAGMQLFDRWTFDLLRRVVSRKGIHWPGLSSDLCVILLVAAIAIAGEIVAAVVVGVGVAVVIFTIRMSRGVVRREQYGDTARSRRRRDAADAALLQAHGRAILALELEGPMFFASAEALHNRIHAAAAQGVRYVILDVSRLSELDSTGARILLQANTELRAAGHGLLVCGMQWRPELAALFRDHGIAAALGAERIFTDLDRALEWCENALLESLRSADTAADERPFDSLDIVRGIDAADRAALQAALVRREYRAGETVFRQGEPGDALYVIARGTASAWLGDAGSEDRRLMTFSQGTFFGEMALLDRQPRSATIVADGPLVCHVLERAAFDRLAISHPRAGVALLANLGRELSLRMRETNRTLADR